jgi:hypothetical protein
MSMSEFDKQLNNESDDVLSLSALEQVVPPDFGEDDLIFAHELNSIFSPEQEELPPYFVQTLLASEDQLFRPVEPGFEHKTRARVFRRLKLRRRLFRAPRSAFDALITGLSNIYARGSLLASIFAFTLIMLVTVAFTGPSFASGMAILLHGAPVGVYQVNTYPKNVHSASYQHKFPQNNANNQLRQITLLAAQQQLRFKMYWPQSLPGNYALESINLYHGADQSCQSCFNGPILELVYSLNGVTPRGTGQIVIREFMPNEDVYQVVPDKAVKLIQVDHYGQPAAIYVDGQWVGRNLPRWSYGERSELIYQQNGVGFWIAGDQFDGIGQKALWKIAQSLQTTPFNRMVLMAGDTTYVSQADLENVLDPFTHDLIVTYSDDNPNSLYYISLSAYQTGTPIPQTHTNTHSH